MWIKACTTHQVHLSISLLSKLKLHLRASLPPLLIAVELMKFGGVRDWSISSSFCFVCFFCIFHYLMHSLSLWISVFFIPKSDGRIFT